MSEIAKNQITLAEAAALVEKYLSFWDSYEGEFNEEAVKAFHDGLFEVESLAKPQISRKVDGWIGFFDSLDAHHARYREAAAFFTDKARAIEKLKENRKAYLKSVVDANPSVEFRGDFGKVYSRKNKAGVHFRIPLERKSLGNIVAPALVELDPTIQKYCDVVSVLVLSTDRVREDLEADPSSVAFARLEESESLIVPKIRAKKGELET